VTLLRRSLSVLLSTYERPRELAALLRALADQSDREFQLVITDDGSGPEIRDIVERWRGVFGESLVHVWQPDEGYRLGLVRNRGALAARGDYLVFLDGDCIPRRRFVEAMRRAAIPGWFVAGRRLELGGDLSARVLDEHVPVQRWSLRRFALRKRGVIGLSALTARDRRRVGRTGVPEFEPHANAYGFLLGLARADFERANGFDARFVGWGEEDVDLAARLRRLGLRCGHAGPQATVLHLWHPPSKPPGERNQPLLLESEESARAEAVVGLRELQAELAAQSSA
jgi:glycosyltransferase involved in cell wall biosynthesis